LGNGTAGATFLAFFGGGGCSSSSSSSEPDPSSDDSALRDSSDESELDVCAAVGGAAAFMGDLLSFFYDFESGFQSSHKCKCEHALKRGKT
jgi:hypothetical protein